MKIIAGVYRVIVAGKSYVGSSIDVYRRWKQHENTLKIGTHDNKYLQKEYDKCKCVSFELLEEIVDADANTLVDRENYYIQKYKAEYNIVSARKNANRKPLYKFDLNGKLITSYSSMQAASTATGISISNLMHAAQENESLTKTAGGYYWRYTDTITIPSDERHHRIYVYNLWGEYLTSFESLSNCLTELKLNGDIRTDMSRINRVCRGFASSYKGYRFSYQKYEHLDNSKLLSIKSWFPVIQIAIDKKTAIAIFETAANAARKLNIKTSSEITYAIATGRKCRGYYWTRLGTKWSELLEHPEDTKTETELETADGIV